jgi:hypothetical protein
MLSVLSDDLLRAVLKPCAWIDRVHAATSWRTFQPMVDDLLCEQLVNQLSMDPNEIWARIMQAEQELHDADRQIFEGADVDLRPLRKAVDDAESDLRHVFCAVTVMKLAQHKTATFYTAGLVDSLVALLQVRMDVHIACHDGLPCQKDHEQCPLKSLPSPLPGTPGVVRSSTMHTLRVMVVEVLAVHRYALTTSHVDAIVNSLAASEHDYPPPSGYRGQSVQWIATHAWMDSIFSTLSNLARAIPEETCHSECERAIEDGAPFDTIYYPMPFDDRAAEEARRMLRKQARGDVIEHEWNGLDSHRFWSAGRQLRVAADNDIAAGDTAGFLHLRHFELIIRSNANGGSDLSPRGCLLSAGGGCWYRFFHEMWPTARALAKRIALGFEAHEDTKMQMLGAAVLDALGETSTDPDWQPSEVEAAADDEDAAQEDQLLTELVAWGE